MEKEILELVKKEFVWHQNNQDKTDKSQEWKEGFLAGLSHIIILLKKIVKRSE